MKKLMFIISIILCIITIPMVSYADYDNSNGNIIDGMQSAEEELAGDKEKIVESILDDIRTHFNDDSINESVIDFSSAFKGNYYMPFIEANDLTFSDVRNFVDNDDTAYNILIKNEEGKVYGNVDLIKENIDGEKHWAVSSVNFESYDVDYINAMYNLLNEYDIKNSYTYFILGFGDYPKRALVVFKENSNTAEFILIDDVNIISKNEVEFVPNTELGKRTYTYSELKQLEANYVAAKDKTEPLVTASSDNLFNNMLIAGGAVLVLTAAACIIFAVKKKKVKIAE